MDPRDGFGLHIDFAHRVLARSVRVARSGLDDLQVRFAVPGEIGRGEGVSYARCSPQLVRGCAGIARLE